MNRNLRQANEATAETAIRRVTNADLPRSAALLKAISEMSPDPIFAKDVDGRYFYVNPAALTIIGRSAEDVLGHTDLEFHFVLEQAGAVMANDRRIMQTSVAETVEEIWDTPGIGARTYRSTKAPLLHDDGSLIGIVCVSADITAAKEMREASRLSQRRLSLVTELTETIAYAMDRELRFTWVHASAVGDALEGLIGGTLHDLFAKDSADRILDLYSEVLRKGQRMRFETRAQSLFKTQPQYIDFVVEPLRDTGDAITACL